MRIVDLQCGWLCGRRLVVSLVYFDDGAVGILQEDLIPATHRPDAVIGELDVFLSQHGLERLDIISSKRDVTAIDRVETLFGPERDAEILRCDMKLGRAVR